MLAALVPLVFSVACLPRQKNPASKERSRIIALQSMKDDQRQGTPGRRMNAEQ
ncbi:MAG: hypothetical protein ACXW2W_20380 [Telluria sp.]